MTRLQELSDRRRALVARCAEQRTELAAELAKVGRCFRIGHVAQSAARAWPLVVAAALVPLLLRRPVRMLRWASTALSWYTLAHRLWGVFRSVVRS
jgi:hypothetical protein